MISAPIVEDIQLNDSPLLSVSILLMNGVFFAMSIVLRIFEEFALPLSMWPVPGYEFSIFTENQCEYYPNTVRLVGVTEFDSFSAFTWRYSPHALYNYVSG